ncbi:hypothetical protein OSTOST_04110 [Ostertagia ostertagi]
MNGAWLIMDNAKIHKTEEVRRLLDDTPYQLKFLSPYSYMLNPAENVFSKIQYMQALTESNCDRDAADALAV